MHTAHFVIHPANGIRQVQRTTVTLHFTTGVSEIQPQIPDGQMRTKRMGCTHQIVPCDMVSLYYLSGKEQLPQPVQHFVPEVLVLFRIFLARPHRGLIQSQTLRMRAPINHGSQTAIAQRQSFHPLRSRTVVPQRQSITFPAITTGP